MQQIRQNEQHNTHRQRTSRRCCQPRSKQCNVQEEISLSLFPEQELTIPSIMPVATALTIDSFDFFLSLKSIFQNSILCETLILFFISSKHGVKNIKEC